MSRTFNKVILDLENQKKEVLNNIDLNALLSLVSPTDYSKVWKFLSEYWKETSNPTDFREFTLRVLRRITTFHTFERNEEQHFDFWKEVYEKGNYLERKEAILACGSSGDLIAIEICSAAWRYDEYNVNRALALEITGSMANYNRAVRKTVMEELREAVASNENWAQLGALFGLSFINDSIADSVIRMSLEYANHDFLAVLAFAILSRRNHPSLWQDIIKHIEEKKVETTSAASMLAIAYLSAPSEVRKLLTDVFKDSANPLIQQAAFALLFDTAASGFIFDLPLSLVSD